METRTADARREQIVQRLMAAVEHLLDAGESYTEVSVERLVTEAGLSRSTFYVYFEDKGALLRALSAGIVSELTAAAQEWWSRPPGASREEIQASMRRIVAAYRPHQVLMAAVVDAASYDTRVREEFGGMLDGVIAGVAAHIREGQQHGTIHAGLDPETTASWLTWMTERGLYNLVRRADDATAVRLADTLTTIVWNTLYR